MFQENVQVLWNENVGPSYYRIGLTCHQGYATAKPGQFIMLRLPDQMVPLLRRPFSIHRIINTDGSTTGLELLYKVVGEGTKKLSRCRQGDIVDILGPLGNGFSFFDRYKQIAVVAGGIGVGMDEDIIKDIFMPFFTTKPVNEGTGLGLAVVHGIVTAHKGFIDVVSKIGKGTCFNIKLPIMDLEKSGE